MQNSGFLAKVGCQQTQELGRQSNFRNQKHGTLAQSQTMGNELNIDRSFTGAGDTVQQRNARILPCHLLRKILKATLLGRIQLQRAIQFGRLDLPAPQHGPFRQSHIAQLFQPVYGSHGSACEIAQLLHRHTAQAAQQFQNRFLHGCGFGTLGRKLHSFFRRRGQSGYFFCLISGFPLEIRLGCDPLLPQKIGKRLMENFLIGNQIPKGRFLCLSSQVFQKSQNLRSMFLADGLFLPGSVFRQRKGILRPEPESGRQHTANGIVKGTEVPFPQEGGQPQLFLRQQGLLIQAAVNGLQPGFVSGFHRQNHTFGALIGTAKGQLDTLTRQNLHTFGNPIGIGLINGKIRRRNSNFRNHAIPSLPAALRDSRNTPSRNVRIILGKL